MSLWLWEGMAGKVPEYCKQNIMGHSDGTMEGQSERTCGQEGLCSGGLMAGNKTPEGTRPKAFHATHWQIICLSMFCQCSENLSEGLDRV